MEEESPSKRVASLAIVERRFCASKLAGPEPSWYLETALRHLVILKWVNLIVGESLRLRSSEASA